MINLRELVASEVPVQPSLPAACWGDDLADRAVEVFVLSLVRAEMRAKLFREKPPACLCLGARAGLCGGQFGVCFSPRWNRENRGVPWVPCLAPWTEHPLGTHTQRIISSRAKITPLLLISCFICEQHRCKAASPSGQRVLVLIFILKSRGSIVLRWGGRDSRASTFSLATNLLPASLCLAAPWD